MTGPLSALSRLFSQARARANAAEAAAELEQRRRAQLEADAFVADRSHHPEASAIR